MPTRLLVLCLLAVGPFAAAAPIPKPGPKTNAEKIVGTWRLTKSSLGSEDRVSLTVEFSKDGALTIRQGRGTDDPAVYAGTYKVDGDKVPYSVKAADEEKSETLTIKKLTDDVLVVVDPDDVREEFKREPAKK